MIKSKTHTKGYRKKNKPKLLSVVGEKLEIATQQRRGLYIIREITWPRLEE